MLRCAIKRNSTIVIHYFRVQLFNAETLKIIKNSALVSFGNIRSKQMVMETLLVGSSISMCRARDPLPSWHNGYFFLPFSFSIHNFPADEFLLFLVAPPPRTLSLFFKSVALERLFLRFCSYILSDGRVNSHRTWIVLSEMHIPMNS